MSFNGVNAIEKGFNNYLKTWVDALIVGYDNNNTLRKLKYRFFNVQFVINMCFLVYTFCYIPIQWNINPLYK